MTMPETSTPLEITADELATSLAGTAPPVLIDVREQWEFDICALPGSRLLTLGALPSHIDDLQLLEDKDVVMICHHGVRSLRATLFLHSTGLKQVRSLKGGIDRWARTIDLSMPVY